MPPGRRGKSLPLHSGCLRARFGVANTRPCFLKALQREPRIGPGHVLTLLATAQRCPEFKVYGAGAGSFPACIHSPALEGGAWFDPPLHKKGSLRTHRGHSGNHLPRSSGLPKKRISLVPSRENPSYKTRSFKIPASMTCVIVRVFFSC